MRTLLPVAVRLGVTVMTGTDVAGTVADEVSLLAQFGLPPVEALRAATTAARAFLGAPTLEAGARGDVVTDDADPRGVGTLPNGVSTTVGDVRQAAKTTGLRLPLTPRRAWSPRWAWSP
jgi:imidazolonepropionase-like amidohydrolase